MGFKFFTLYILFVYIIQIVIYNIISQDLVTIYNINDYPLYNTFLFVLIFLILVSIFGSILPRVKKVFIISSYKINFLMYLITMLNVIYLLSAFYFFQYYEISFRHHYRLRDVDIIIKLLFLMTPFIKIIVLFIFISFLKNKKITTIMKLNLLLILVASILSLNSSLGVIFISFIITLLIYPSMYTKKVSLKSLLMYFILILIIAFSVVFIGLANKGGYSYALEFYTSIEGFKLLLLKVFMRISTSFLSLNILLNEHIFNYELQLSTYENLYKIFIQKVNIIFPFIDNLNSDVISVNRINYEFLFINHTDTGGASPGLIGSIFYIPIFPFSVLMIIIYVLFVLSAINRYFENLNYNFFVPLIVLYFVSFLFDSPLKLLIILEPATLAFLVFYLSSFIEVKSKNV